jgi:hypothetical protein
MNKENPFDIKNDKPHPVTNNETDTPQVKKQSRKKQTKYKKYPSKSYTNEEIKKLLVGYIEVGKNKWADIPNGSHIRYIKSDGTFVRGGFITNHWLNKEGKPFIHLANNIKKDAPGYITWPMAHDSVSRVFKKPDAKTGIEMDIVRGKTVEIISQINKLVDVVKEQKKRIDSLESDMKKLYLIIKKI